MRFLKLILVVIISMSSLYAQKLLTPEVLVTMKRISEPKISPDGKWILYNVGKPDLAENKINKDLYLITIDGKEKKQITNDASSEFGAIWSPDGKRIAFLSAKDGAPQIFSMNIDGSDLKKISNMPNGVANFSFSPDGKYISFTSDVKILQNLADRYPQFPKANVRIYDKLPVRHWDDWEDENFSHLFVMNSDGTNPVDLMPGEPFDCPLTPFGGGEEIAWSPDSKEIAYTCKKTDNFVNTTNSSVYLVPVTGGKSIDITVGLMGYDRYPLYSPDGKWIAFHSLERDGFESDRARLMLYNRQTKEITELSKTLDQWVGEIVWTKDSKKILFTAEDGPLVQIYEINVPGGEWKILTKDQNNHEDGLGLTPDGKTVVYCQRNMNRPFEIYSMNIDGSNQKKLTSENDEIFKDLKPAIIEQKWFTAKDGKKFHAWIILPPDFDKNKKYPMITYCQGGPQSTISQYFSYRWNFMQMASMGYVIVAANRRGVPGFGQAWNDAISKDWGGMPMQDLLTATDEMCKEPYIDKNRLCAMGASAGGYAAFWLAGNHNKRFSAFVAHTGVFNVVSKYGSTEELFFPNWEFGGPYWEEKNKANYEKNSPHMYANNWDTPILISTGEKDFRVPYTQSLEAFTVAQVKGLPSEFIIYPKENHWILKVQEQALYYYEIFKFLDKYCKNK
jgi:dipeptidyl aminopeptidase/acylaminoacyl peptidase